MSVKFDRPDSQSNETISAPSKPAKPAPEMPVTRDAVINKKMVGWYDPVQLLRTAKDVVISTIIGQHADRRLIETITDENGNEEVLFYNFSEWKTDELHERLLSKWEKGKGREEILKDSLSKSQIYTRNDWDQKAGGEEKTERERIKDEGIWIDYVSDVGDGFNSTYAVAHGLAQEKLPGVMANREALKRGDILIFGGDEVYPAADSNEYRDRLEEPYLYALPKVEKGKRPSLFALPGNHDWYDSLGNFSRIFCDNYYFPHGIDVPENEEPDRCGWRLPQHRSYFAIKLPHNWWLVGIDVQLNSDLDGPQIDYFQQVAEKCMEEGDRIILCCPEPYWVFAQSYRKYDATFIINRLSRRYLENRIFKNQKIVVYLAGDIHHYRHHVSLDGETHRITAGGGGAFLHPTHTFRDSPKETIVAEIDAVEVDIDYEADLTGGAAYRLEAVYPTEEESRRLGWIILWGFLFRNPKFGLATMFAYVMSSWSVLSFMDLKERPILPWHWRDICMRTVEVAIQTPVVAFWTLVILGGFYFFTETHSKNYKRWGGFSHGAAHVIANHLITWSAYFLTVSYMKSGESKQIIATALIIALGAFLIGPIIMGVYLFISVNVFHRHYNEAFSSLKIENWKNFVRMKIDSNGDLTVYPIGLRKTPQKWRDRNLEEYFRGEISWVQPENKEDLKFELIEEPFTVKGKV